ncbi:helix-turn-helix domain-containing protein [Mycobacteroides abscessus]|uniref:helix-turn-helix domain-containing protein n=1 Tax=Mycobacteroides abscessus TaxID=36809 RepID=UPI000468A80C|nr:helix-turn-helix transcriptional regulator [Mycobacteroides abscessus]
MAEDWAALARAVRTRRAELGLTQVAVGQAGGPSDIVVGRVENNEEPRPRPDTLRKLDKGLGWEPGTSLAILAGGESTASSRPKSQIRVQRNGEWGEWRELESRPRGATPAGKSKEERLQQYSSNAEVSAQMIDRVLMLSVDFTADERARLDGIRREIRRLPETLEPWIDTPAGMNQYMHRMSSLMKESGDILRRAADAKYGPEEQYGPEEDANANASVVTNLADRRPAPPPDIDDPDVAASRREKKSDGERGLSSGWWGTSSVIAGPKAVPGPAPEPIRAVVPAAVFHEHADAAAGVQKRLNAIHEAFTQQRLTTDLVTLALNAIDDYGISSRRFMAELRRVELDATQDQIDSALRIFEQGWGYADSVSEYISELLPMAPDAYEAGRIIAARRSMEELADFFHHAHDVWVESGRSSKSLEAATPRSEKQSNGERDDDE